MSKWPDAENDSPDPRVTAWFRAEAELPAAAFVAAVLASMQKEQRRIRALRGVAAVLAVILLWLLLPAAIEFSLWMADLNVAAVGLVEEALASPVSWLLIATGLAGTWPLLRRRFT